MPKNTSKRPIKNMPGMDRNIALFARHHIIFLELIYIYVKIHIHIYYIYYVTYITYITVLEYGLLVDGIGWSEYTVR
jgi:hypothetical protein